MGIADDLKLQYRTGNVVLKLIFWNLGISLLFLVVYYLFPSLYRLVFPWFGLSSDGLTVLTRPWTLLSYAFVHAGFVHLLFNVLVLHFVGNLFLTYFTQKQLLTVYLLGGVFGGVLFLVCGQFIAVGHVLVGASAAVIAPLIALAFYAPYMQVRLLLIGYVKIWQIALVLVILDVIQLSTSNTGGHLAHLGGALFGLLYIKSLQKGYDLAKPIDRFIQFFIHLFDKKEKVPFKKVYVNKQKQKRSNKTTAAHTMFSANEHQKKIDEILDKISKSGYDSLTKEEKDFLFNAGK